MSQPLRGVNLGGWLVLEPWMTPSLFAGSGAMDEYSYCETLSPQRRAALKRHRDTFITKQDFVWLAEQGIQAVRLPVGYWVYGDESPYEPTILYVDKAFRWAKQTGIRILLDLHGAPGSQNGAMHSGKQGKCEWQADPRNRQRTLEILRTLAKQYGRHPALLGISLLNEPAADTHPALLDSFYRQAYRAIEPHINQDIWIVFSDAFKPRRWFRRLPSKQYPRLVVDYHHYQIFGQIDRWLPARLQLWRARHLLPAKIRRMQKRHTTIVGEWSPVLRSDKLARYSPAERRQLQESYIAAQVRAFDDTAAWFMWNYKTEPATDWDYRRWVDCLTD